MPLEDPIATRPPSTVMPVPGRLDLCRRRFRLRAPGRRSSCGTPVVVQDARNRTSGACGQGLRQSRRIQPDRRDRSLFRRDRSRRPGRMSVVSANEPSGLGSGNGYRAAPARKAATTYVACRSSDTRARS